ncbi:2-amino-4%2C5-dihydroxy-6-one-heptanoic acid-7-phosphate synthase [Blautia hydrogenotrophica]|uniref:class I fructose-bisphosphate aldolase n=1 Tax=Blautia hydrogenotrophica TaxID=53443 RepID=UPI0006C41D8D|nr:fructose-bisphosphate aldolase [Blautia hydrogenotrophica]CUM93214.1 2-amino-4%2C5-dihydroxy-6-one-heptanoic acid-7-phosphate synthase [Blautia hydrogenotrophica]SCH48877.1 2-amino-4%2C5-dihydroxy-6-one-heptanoic acid-7-phosphate synthase [uncultured Blautia sp.]
MAMLGKKVRMSRLVNAKSNKMMAITVDHAISRGIAPMTGLHQIQNTIDKIILGRPDAMTMTKGIAEHCMWDHAGQVAMLMKVSNYSPVAPTKDTVFGSVDEAIRMGADAVSMGAMTLGDFQGEQFEIIGKYSEECMAKGMPLIGHVYPKGESVPADKRTAWENIAYCVRSACELGMDIVKTTYTGDPDSMAKVVSCVPSSFRVVIQGGDACKTLDDYLQMTRDAMDCGVGGVTMGRFVWDYKDVTALVIALRYLIHEGYSVKETKELLAQLENDKNYSEF